MVVPGGGLWRVNCAGSSGQQVLILRLGVYWRLGGLANINGEEGPGFAGAFCFMFKLGKNRILCYNIKEPERQPLVHKRKVRAAQSMIVANGDRPQG